MGNPSTLGGIWGSAHPTFGYKGFCRSVGIYKSAIAPTIIHYCHRNNIRWQQYFQKYVAADLVVGLLKQQLFVRVSSLAYRF
ncbi:MAG TPA: hypothetical protein V6D09_14170 [Leptolyngbyaceae cyanobacterium]